MHSHWTFGHKIAAGFAAAVAFSVVIGVAAILALQVVVASKDRVIVEDSQALLAATQMQTERVRVGNNIRMYLLTGDEADLAALEESKRKFDEILASLKDEADAAGLLAIENIEKAEADYRAAVDRVLALRQGGADVQAVVAAFTREIEPVRGALSTALADFLAHRQNRMDNARLASTETAAFATTLIAVLSGAAALLAAAIAFYLSRTLNRQIGAAVHHVQSSSAELQSAASQQASGVKEQVTSMNEINTTINELLATSRQIAESAQRVAHIAGETASTARSGSGTVERASDSIIGIRRQVDLVVSHMLELGKKSQEIGSVLDIVTELAEQTNILSINATIEAAGAGETGRRFAIVADEIRKLADRVGSSAKEIRGLIDDVRTSVNTTVMATETGSKAVDSGSMQFGEVASLFKQIANLVTTTTEAAREIELSTKQQTSAVEQVNIAISNVAQATRETETSAGQTIQTASQLASTSRSLLRLVQARMAA